jgi:hypothetical protein
MKNVIEQLQSIVDKYTPLLQQLSKEELETKPSPEKWSGKEVIGHLIDSAQSNIRRFVVAQYEEAYIVYKQDEWVKLADYQNYPPDELIQLWALLNKHICRVLQTMPKEKYESICLTNNHTPHTLKWLAEDYNRHLLHHLHVILKMEPLAYP